MKCPKYIIIFSQCSESLQPHLLLYRKAYIFNQARGYKLFSCSTQLSKKFQRLIKTKIQTNEEVSALSLSDVVFIMLINVKMLTIVGILTFMSRINFVLS